MTSKSPAAEGGRGVIHPDGRLMRIILLGNAGAGKSTMAESLVRDRDVPRLSLDEIAWAGGPVRRPLADTLVDLRALIDRHEEWIIEGCYGDLVEAALPHCTELRFLDPGVDVCVEHCLRRPWEPSKFPSLQEQNAMLNVLLEWVRRYETRDDEYGRKRHRQIFDSFTGPKREYRRPAEYSDGVSTRLAASLPSNVAGFQNL